ncbi:hypothetical protein [Thalassiella azotivora]
MNRPSRRHVRTAALPGAVGLAAALVLTGCGDDEPEDTTTDVTQEESADEETGSEPEDVDDNPDDAAVETAEVLENPEEFEGQEVVIAGQVDETVTEYMFTVSEAEDPNQSLLVLHDGSADVEEAADVEINGQVRQSLEIGEAEAFVGQDVDDAVIGTYEGDVYVQASEVMVTEPAP